jgi:hypothetical protein
MVRRKADNIRNLISSMGYVYFWRKEWDSNPRRACTLGGFQDRCLKPLGHPSHALISRGFIKLWLVSREAIATALLPNLSRRRFRVGFYGQTHRGVNPRHGVL